MNGWTFRNYIYYYLHYILKSWVACFRKLVNIAIDLALHGPLRIASKALKVPSIAKVVQVSIPSIMGPMKLHILCSLYWTPSRIDWESLVGSLSLENNTWKDLPSKGKLAGLKWLAYHSLAAMPSTHQGQSSISLQPMSKKHWHRHRGQSVYDCNILQLSRKDSFFQPTLIQIYHWI